MGKSSRDNFPVEARTRVWVSEAEAAQKEKHE